MTVPALGAVVSEHLGLRWEVRLDPFDLGLSALCGLALRDNPRRAHLVVSTVLAKHVPVRPSVALERAGQLAALVARSLTDVPVVMGFCETATGLGDAVAGALDGAGYVHTTRRPDPSRPTAAGFSEEHSHATEHHLQPGDLLDDHRTVVLVDDELTTGTTALNTVAALNTAAALQAVRPRARWVLATLLDLRDDDARTAFARRCAQLDVDVEVVALLDGTLHQPPDVLARAVPLQRDLVARPAPSPGPARARVVPHPRDWPSGVPTGGRYGLGPAAREARDRAVRRGAAGLELPPGRVLVVGVEELMAAPVLLARTLEGRGLDVHVQSTTRSPVLPLDEPGYAVRRRLVFPSPDNAGRSSFLCNIAVPDDAEPWSAIVVVTEDDADACTPLLQALRPWADEVHLVGLE